VRSTKKLYPNGYKKEEMKSFVENKKSNCFSWESNPDLGTGDSASQPTGLLKTVVRVSGINFV
jgi:hypothetical protein